MKQWMSYPVVFLLGCGVTYFVTRPKAVAPVAAPAKNPLEVFAYLGIRHGDLLISANGVKDPTMLEVAAEGYRRGNLCVVFERDSELRELCLRKAVLAPTSRTRALSQPSTDVRTVLQKPEVAEETRRVPFIDPATGKMKGFVDAPKSVENIKPYDPETSEITD